MITDNFKTMGQHAADILNGDVDEQTGEWIGGGQGFPRTLNRHQQKKEKINLSQPVLKVVQEKLIKSGYTIIMIKEINYGHQLRLISGTIVNIYSTGKIVLQGKPDVLVNELLNK